MISREQAFELLKKHTKNPNLLRHGLAAEAAMRALAQHFNEDGARWGLVGLLHDGDYEETKDEPAQHTQKMAKWLESEGETDEGVISAILSHNYAHTGQNPPKNNMEWSIYCCDELTGFIVAVTLVQPDKKLASVTVDSVLKKFPAKAFAASVNRDQISLCEEKLGIKLDKFVEIVLMAMQAISKDLGL